MALPDIGRKFYLVSELVLNRWINTDRDTFIRYAEAELFHLQSYLVFRVPGGDYFKGDATIPISNIGRLVSSDEVVLNMIYDSMGLEVFPCQLVDSMGIEHEVPDNITIDYHKLAVSVDEVAKMEATYDELLAQPVSLKKSDLRVEGTDLHVAIEMLLNEDHNWHSRHLATAIKAWIALYAKRPGHRSRSEDKPIGGHTSYIHKWLVDNVDEYIKDGTEAHYRYIVKPDSPSGPKKI